jgi:hypothetical protein
VVKKRSRDPARMQLRAMAMARWVLPVPVPPTRTTLHCWAMKPPAARSRTNPSLIGVPLKAKSSTSLARGGFAIVSWYVIERACFSEISARWRSPTKRRGPRATVSYHLLESRWSPAQDSMSLSYFSASVGG